MGRGILTEKEQEKLKKNPYVLEVNEKSVKYSEEFKKYFIKEYVLGKSPMEIFKSAGFDPKMLGTKRIERAAARWRELEKIPINHGTKITLEK